MSVPAGKDCHTPSGISGWTGQSESLTQTNVCKKSKQQPRHSWKMKTKNCACGSDLEIKLGFFGLLSVTSDEASLASACVSKIAFRSIHRIVALPSKYGYPTSIYKNVSRENRLLLFSMIIKLGLCHSPP